MIASDIKYLDRKLEKLTKEFNKIVDRIKQIERKVG
tara:strand:- start:629 stop:736 length:108 start_codon:yes stop_codon:yes gene_type:complete